jgi:hypothetical protein
MTPQTLKPLMNDKSPIQERIDQSADKFSKYLQQYQDKPSKVPFILQEEYNEDFCSEDNESFYGIVQALPNLHIQSAPTDRDTLCLSINEEDFFPPNFDMRMLPKKKSPMHRPEHNKENTLLSYFMPVD